MKYKKIIFIFAITILLLYSFYIAITRTNNNNSERNNKDLTIPTSQGQVKINDITQHPLEKVKGSYKFAASQDYSMDYFDNDLSFSIVLLSQPLDKARQEAEDEFLKELNIGISDACKLSVSLTVPFDVDQNLSGQNYGLSFCPNGINF